VYPAVQSGIQQDTGYKKDRIIRPDYPVHPFFNNQWSMLLKRARTAFA
jgi:hypothetical protein